MRGAWIETRCLGVVLREIKRDENGSMQMPTVQTRKKRTLRKGSKTKDKPLSKPGKKPPAKRGVRKTATGGSDRVHGLGKPVVNFSLQRAPKGKSLYSKGVYPPEFSDEFKKRVRDRDGNRCSIHTCGKTRRQLGQELDVHHIDYTKYTVEGNCISLCRECHKQVHRVRSERYTWMVYFRKIVIARTGKKAVV